MKHFGTKLGNTDKQTYIHTHRNQIITIIFETAVI